MQKPGFQFLWKLQLNNQAKQLNSLTPAVLLDRYIGYRGFRSLGFVGGSSDSIFAIDTDLARMEWEKQFSSGSPQRAGSPACPGGMTANVTRPTVAAFPTAPAGRFGGGFGRGGPARSAVGKPDEGAAILSEPSAAPGGGGFPGPPGGPPRPGAAGAPGGPGGPGGPFGGFRREPSVVFALSGDGMLHKMYVSNGVDAEPPVRFLPPDANAHGLIVVDNVAYTATTQGCGGVANGVWALDLASGQVTAWKSNGGGVSGSSGAAIGPDGTLYLATGEGELVALEPKTLKMKDRYSPGRQEFTSSPVVFEFKGKTLIAATTKDGRIHLLDSANLGGADHQTPLFKTPANSNPSDFVPGALASWQDSSGTRWVLTAAAGAIVAWKAVDLNGAPALERGWVSREMVSPLPPMIVNGVVFAVSGGSSRALLYALDATTGKELWNSGNAIASSVRSGGLSAGGSQLYVGAHDGTLYAFGFPIEH